MSFSVYGFNHPHICTDEDTGIRFQLLGLGCPIEEGQPSLEGKIPYAVQMSVPASDGDRASSSSKLNRWWSDKSDIAKRATVTMLFRLNEGAAGTTTSKETPPSLFDLYSYQTSASLSTGGDFAVVSHGYLEP